MGSEVNRIIGRAVGELFGCLAESSDSANEAYRRLRVAELVLKRRIRGLACQLARQAAIDARQAFDAEWGELADPNEPVQS